jgi:L-seryl-tRNA(Ser) seleniumtransferase
LLPSVNDVAELVTSDEQYPHGLVVLKTREVLSDLRERSLRGEAFPRTSREELLPWIADRVIEALEPGLRRVINATGVVLHTGLGRAPLSDNAVETLTWAARYCNVQADLEEGKRSRRETHVESLFRYITGCEAAAVVNNNAAATLIALTAVAKGKEVVVSRGELVEIGGSFRIPEVMAQSGAILVEVGCTNRTHLDDYQKAITAETGVLLKVHTSNYKIQGFTSEVSLSELSSLARHHGLVLLHDMGSGSLVDLEPFGLPGEPTVAESLKAGADLVTFSGDKLFGGPQAGIVVGKRSLIDAVRQHPLARAVRVDKLVLATMEATLRSFTDPGFAVEDIPGLRMITTDKATIHRRSRNLLQRMKRRYQAISASLSDGVSKVGSGAYPIQELPTTVIEIGGLSRDPSEVARALRKGTPSVFVRITQDKLVVDLRTVFPDEESALAEAVAGALAKTEG